MQVSKAITTVKIKFNNSNDSKEPLIHPLISSQLNKNDKIQNEGFERIKESSFEKNCKVNGKELKTVRPPPHKQIRDLQALLTSQTNHSPQWVFLLSYDWWTKWSQYCQNDSPNSKSNSPSIGESLPPPPIDNLSLVEKKIEKEDEDEENDKYVLKPKLKRNIDYVIVSKDAWDALRCWYGGGPVIPRRINESDYSKTPKDFYTSLLMASTSMDNEIEVDLYPEVIPSLNEVLQSDSQETGGENTVIRLNSVSFNDCGLSASKTNDTDVSTLLSASSDTFTNSNNVNVVEQSFQSPRRVEIVTANTCFVCRSVAFRRCNKCSAVYYCSDSCQKSHWKFHKVWCGEASQYKSLPSNEFERKVSVGRKGKTGLVNLGNSCYMNSCLQCLSHIVPLTVHFLSDKYKDDLNLKSRDGTGGKLAEAYADLVQHLWLDGKKVVMPAKFKEQLGKIRPEYAGLQQHDAHEVVELLLDKLHEDLNKITVKPYMERPEGDGSDDFRVAAEAWARHLQRENSIITQLAGSQMRSELVCPDCGKVSVCFEYQQTLQVAIPRSSKRLIQVLFVPGEIPALFSKPSTRSLLAKEKFLQMRNTILRPVKLAFELDSKQPIKVLQDRVLEEMKKYNTELGNSLKEEIQEILDYELSLGDTTNTKSYKDLINSQFELYSIENFKLFETGSKQGSPNCYLSNILQPDSPCLKINCDTPVTTYRCLTGLEGFMTFVVMQRRVNDKRVHALLRGNAGVGDSTTTAVQLVGTPMIISVDKKMSVGRLRHFIWKMMSRFLIRENQEDIVDESGEIKDELNQLSQLIHDAEKNHNIKLQLELSKLMNLRAVNQHGSGFFTQYWKRQSAGHMGLPNLQSAPSEPVLGKLAGQRNDLTGLLVFDRLLGSSIPDDNKLTIEEYFANQDDFQFVSVDWSGLWNELLNVSEMIATTEHKSCSILYPSLPPKETKAGDEKTDYTAYRESLSSQGILTLEKCLQEHTREEVLDEANAWYCSKCSKHMCAKKNVKFWNPRLPSVLIVVLKRFEFQELSSSTGRTSSIHREKIDTYVDFPIDGLNLAQFCRGNNVSGLANTVEAENCLYDLFAVCNHYGRMGFGHYTAFARDWKADTLSDTWCSFDDNDVEAIKDPSRVVSKAAYILFYRRRP